MIYMNCTIYAFASVPMAGYTRRMNAIESMGKHGDRLRALLGFVYGDRAREAERLALEAIERHPALARSRGSEPAGTRFTERDALLISYGDMIASAPGDGRSSLARLGAFIDERMPGLFTFLHILPFFPYSSDDGFSVMDYRAVDPALGGWDDILALGENRSLAFDLVLNHASAKGVWFEAFKAGRSPYDRFFVTRPLDYDASSVLRPRTHPLITPMTLDDGTTVGLWTTFSADQVDLDFSEPAVFAEFIDIILSYAERGARMLRLDAIAYLWKRDGTGCAHLPETHAVVRAIRALVDGLGLGMAVLTETNVPHEENLSYFGGFPLIGSGSGGDDSGDDSGDEAHMVYNFSLPPLVLHAFATGDAGPLSSWAASLRVPPGGVMLNFLASHDGVGVTPARGLVDDLEPLVRAVKERGGLVSYKATPEGPVPYELNISWADAVAAPGADESERAAALVASYAIACAMDGVPAVYFHSAIGSRNWADGPALLGYNRAINRERPRLDELEAALDSPASTRALALAGLSSLLRERARRPAFSPTSPRRGYPAQGPVFIVERGTADEATLAVVNCSRREAPVSLPSGWAGAEAFDPVAGVRVPIPAAAAVSLKGYSVLWLHRR